MTKPFAGRTLGMNATVAEKQHGRQNKIATRDGAVSNRLAISYKAISIDREDAVPLHRREGSQLPCESVMNQQHSLIR